MIKTKNTIARTVCITILMLALMIGIFGFFYLNPGYLKQIIDTVAAEPIERVDEPLNSDTITTSAPVHSNIIEEFVSPTTTTESPLKELLFLSSSNQYTKELTKTPILSTGEQLSLADSSAFYSDGYMLDAKATYSFHTAPQLNGKKLNIKYGIGNQSIDSLHHVTISVIDLGNKKKVISTNDLTKDMTSANEDIELDLSNIAFLEITDKSEGYGVKTLYVELSTIN